MVTEIKFYLLGFLVLALALVILAGVAKLNERLNEFFGNSLAAGWILAGTWQLSGWIGHLLSGWFQ